MSDLTKEGSNLHTRTEDGLMVYHPSDQCLPLMVSASDHNSRVAVLTSKIKALEGRSMRLRNGKVVSELEYYRLRWPSISKWAKEQQNEQ